MGKKLVQVRTLSGNLNPREFQQFIESLGGRNLPSPLIFPPLFMVELDEAKVDEIKKKFPQEEFDTRILQDIDD